jgi:hypothetical protein
MKIKIGDLKASLARSPQIVREMELAADATALVPPAAEGRTLAVSFVSEKPVRRAGYWEVLRTDAEGCDLSALPGGPVLWMHQAYEQPVGTVLSAGIDPDRVGRATVKIGRTEEAESLFKNLQDGIVSRTSVGTDVVDVEIVGELEGLPIARFKHRPYEISFVSLPADSSVGVNRSRSQVVTAGETKMEDDQIKREAASAETARVQELLQITRDCGLEAAEADSAIAQRMPVADFKSLAIKRLRQNLDAQRTKTVTLTPGESKKYSILRAIRAILPTASQAERDAAGYEFELSQQIARAAGKDPRGIFIPHSVLSVQRAMSGFIGTGDTGATSLIATQQLAAEFIPLLRAATICDRAGVRFLPGLVGSVSIPAQTSGGTAHWIDPESETSTPSKAGFGAVTLSPKTVSAVQLISRTMLLQSTPAVDQLVRKDQQDHKVYLVLQDQQDQQEVQLVLMQLN